MMDGLRNSVSSSNATDGGKTHYSGGHNDLEEISDPATFEDETHESAVGKVTGHPFLAFVLGLVAVFVVIWLFFLERKLAFSIVTNRYVHYALAAFLLLLIGTYHGRTHLRTRLKRLDWLVLASSSHLGFYLGEYIPGGEKVPPRFQPQKGFTLWGYSEEAYSIKEIDPELARMNVKANRSASEEASIRLHPGMTTAKTTWFGTLIFQMSDGLEIDPFSAHTSLHATVPSRADEDALEGLQVELEDATREIDVLNKHLDAVKANHRELLEEVREDRNETIGNFTDHVGDIGEALARPGRSRTDGSSASNSDRPSDRLPEADND